MAENRQQEGGLEKNTTERGRKKNMSKQNDHGRNRGNKNEDRR